VDGKVLLHVRGQHHVDDELADALPHFVGRLPEGDNQQQAWCWEGLRSTCCMRTSMGKNSCLEIT